MCSSDLLCEGLRITALLVSPVIPIAAEKIWNQLGLSDFAAARLADAAWGGLADGAKIQKGDPIFPRFETDEEKAAKAEKAAKKAAKKGK